MPHPRTFNPMLPGTVMANGSTDAPWNAIGTFGGPGQCYYTTTKVDLRGLLMGKESGVALSGVVLQEAGPMRFNNLEGRAWMMVIDMVTTQEPTEQFLEHCFEQPALVGTMPGFLAPTTVLAIDKSPDDQDFNPSMVTWGLWRFMGVDSTFPIGTDLACRTINSSYFGQGEMLVSPHIFWTRVCVTYQDGDTVIAPSATLVMNGLGVDLSMPQEISQMMRSVQR